MEKAEINHLGKVDEEGFALSSTCTSTRESQSFVGATAELHEVKLTRLETGGDKTEIAFSTSLIHVNEII